MSNPKKRIVFVGGGHAHLYALKYAEQFVSENAEILLVSPSQFHYYSGMGPGMLSRIYQPEQLRFDVQAIVQSRKGTFIKGRAKSVDPENRALILEDGARIPYDLISFNVGSHVPAHLIPGAQEEAFPVKPIENLEKVRETILGKTKTGIPKILIMGGGPAGVELAGNILRLVRDHHGQAQIMLANATDRILPNISKRAAHLAEQSLLQRGARIFSNFLAESMAQGRVKSQAGEQIAYDIAILAIGIVPPGIFTESGLKISKDGALLVNDFLHSEAYPQIFGGGDCVAIQGKPLARIGVYAVREGPILFQNLLASLTGKPLVPFKPQKRYLLIFNLGDGTGVFVRWPFVWKGKLAFALKNRIDTRFVLKFQPQRRVP